ncbi:MFS transporter [Brachybacterium saurashtrense]|uniref:MFS transporter n=1 Tax=Brachybacterium saurashtrense TaxID=556288 RepID=A0A345YS55_9MICO|nr:MFS transporter [Brachybacterium saurashtrense]AXK46757.1 MFS transporter [Brachybacterium saurashtrense]RRR22472.1 MFS transporter [Brachybacterium saurashtrense]
MHSEEPEPHDAPASHGVPRRVLLWLAVATFTTGIDGYVLAGLLPDIAADLQVGAAAAGQLVAVFALTSALAGPVLGALTSGWEQRGTIMAALSTFVLGNLVNALAPTYAVALGGRVVAALGGCLLAAAVTGYVVHLVPERHRGRALSFVLGGWMTATALGVPVGLILGQTSWRLPLLMVSAVGLTALVGIALRLPRLRHPATTLGRRLRPLARPRLVGGLLVSTGVLCASYACFTYAVLILEPSHPARWAIIALMCAYGLASMLGNGVTGRLVDRFSPVRVLSVILVLLLVNALFGAIVLTVAAPAVLVVTSVVWFLVAGVGNGGHAVPQQARLAAMAPASAPVVMALNASAVSLGSALGGGLGGLALAAGSSPAHLPLVAAAVLVVTIPLHLLVAGRRPAAHHPAGGQGSPSARALSS